MFDAIFQSDMNWEKHKHYRLLVTERVLMGNIIEFFVFLLQKHFSDLRFGKKLELMKHKLSKSTSICFKSLLSCGWSARHMKMWQTAGRAAVTVSADVVRHLKEKALPNNAVSQGGTGTSEWQDVGALEFLKNTIVHAFKRFC